MPSPHDVRLSKREGRERPRKTRRVVGDDVVAADMLPGLRGKLAEHSEPPINADQRGYCTPASPLHSFHSFRSLHSLPKPHRQLRPYRLFLVLEEDVRLFPLLG